MAKNIKIGGPDSVVLTLTGPALYPATPVSGDPVIMGTTIPGIALFNEDADSEIVAAIGPLVAELSVIGSDGGNSAVTHGQKLYYTDGDTPVLSKKATGIPFGVAWETTAGVRTGNLVAAGATTTIRVLVYPANGIITIAADQITNTLLANMTRGTVKVGGAADAPTDLDAKTAGYILVGDGTDLKSVAVSGDATLTSAGVLQVNKMGVSPKGTVVPQAANAVLVAADLGKIHTNTGAGAGITLTLPAAAGAGVPGKHVKIQVTAAQTVQAVPAAGDKIFLGGSGVADKYCQIAGVIGNFLDLYSDGTDWLVLNYSGVATKQA